ncbi:CCHC-type domain-containing protein [Abeliophyllum distichum]|uniref:CCHC-type domain-containing protein n=1 Tax=Abeliophyllum distichum TaxID=126358 RepID=A0ABD1NW71_9LAMI
MLSGRAGHWWESASRTRIEDEQNNLSWAQFKVELTKKYFPQALQDYKESEFLYLVQGEMEITEYERKFEELSRYATYLVSIELMKARCFERGLRPEVRQIVSSHTLPTFRAVVKMAQTVTFSGLNVKVQEQQYDSGKRNWQNQNRNQISGQFKRQNQGPIRGQSSNIIP